MDENKKYDYQQDFVYTPIGTQDYRNVKVALKVLELKLALKIYSSDEIEPLDLKCIINNLKKEIFDRIQIDIQKDCVIYMYVGDKEYYVDYNKGMLKIYEFLHQVE